MSGRPQRLESTRPGSKEGRAAQRGALEISEQFPPGLQLGAQQHIHVRKPPAAEERTTRKEQAEQCLGQGGRESSCSHRPQ